MELNVIGAKPIAVSEAIFRDGICLPSGSNLTPADLERVLRIIRRAGGHPS